jgi:predicted DsbA family dithiol-disulfide isomerase
MQIMNYLKSIIFTIQIMLVFGLVSCQEGNSTNSTANKNENFTNNKQDKMQIEIWSDVMCPFCYIGKRKFEVALSQFEHKEKIEVVWKSYQLNPDLKTDPSKNSIVALAEQKGISLEESKDMHSYVIEMAANTGLNYNMDKTISANSFKAHRLTHYAKSIGKQLEVEEKLFEAYFILGKNIDDNNTLISIGETVGMNHDKLKKVLLGDHYTDDVKKDIYEAQQVGVRGVPFFMFNKKYTVSGAQESATFLQTLQKSFEEWKKVNPD